jgi:tRNA G18 (ribose-2'-O)-methylase SpoU
VEKLCTEMINIPLDDNVESLNVATAATIIMWECKK